MANLQDVLRSARTYLNDDDGSLWPDQRLIPKVQEAFREMQSRLQLRGVPIMTGISAVFTVPPMTVDDGNLDLSTVPGYPSDIYQPSWCKERMVGQQSQDFVDMEEVDYIPNLIKTTTLNYWCWMQDTIMVLGAINPVQMMIRYTRILPAPQLLTDPVGVLLGEIFLGPKTAALAQGSLGDWDKKNKLNEEAEAKLGYILDNATKEEQNLPARRRGYHRGRDRTRTIRDF